MLVNCLAVLVVDMLLSIGESTYIHFLEAISLIQLRG